VEQYNPVISYLEKHLHAPRFIEAHRLAAFPPPRPGLPPRGTEVGVVLDLMIHDLDIVLHLVNSPVLTVDAVGIPVLSPHEDIANARLSFANGCVANITASRVSPERMRKIRVFQPDAYLSLDYEKKQGEIHTLTAAGIQCLPVPITDRNALAAELEDFVNCVQKVLAGEGPPKPTVSGERGLAALEIACEITAKIAERNQQFPFPKR
jgi:predicted dehydrogenase